MINSTKQKACRLYKSLMVVILMAGTTLLSCAKEDTEVTTYPYLSIANFSPTLGTYDSYIDGIRANSSGAISFGGTLAYVQLAVGDHTISFTTDNSVNKVLTKTLTLNEGIVYSAYLIDKDINMDVLLVKDDMAAVSTDKAFVRFINLSPDAPALDLSVKDMEPLILGKAYKSASAFQSIDPTSYSFEVKSNGTVLARLTDQTFVAGKYYTLISRGLINFGDTDQSFGLQLITNL